MTDTTYNGWTNHATWLANLHTDCSYMANDEWHERATECLERHNGNKTAACYALSDAIKEWFTELAESGVENITALDFLRGYLSEIDWDEIALQYIADAVFEGAEQ